MTLVCIQDIMKESQKNVYFDVLDDIVINTTIHTIKPLK